MHRRFLARIGPLRFFAFAAVLAGALVALPPAARAAFTDVTVTYGLAHGDSMSYAAGFLDYDGDGDVDFYVNNHWKGPAELRRNDGSPPMGSNSAHYGPGNNDRHDQLWADFDNDGDPDQYIIRAREQENELYWNQGCQAFLEGAVAAGIAESASRGREIAVADFDNDGFADIFLASAVRNGFFHPNRLFWNRGDGTFLANSNADAIYEGRLHVAAADYDLNGLPDVITSSSSFNPGRFWRNNGDSTFTNVTSTVFPGIAEPLGQAEGLTWADFDNDGLLDLLACGGNRGVWDYAGAEDDSVRWYTECDPNETKTLVITTDGDSVTVSATKSDWNGLVCWYGGGGDSITAFPHQFGLDQLDGQPPALTNNRQGLFLWRAVGAAADTVRLASGGAGTEILEVGGALYSNRSGILSWSTVAYEPKPPYGHANWANRLFRNQGDGTFVEVTATAFAVNDTTANSKGAAWADYDNDGFLDVFVANGGTVETLNQPNWLFRNNGDGTFTEVAAIEGVVGPTRGMSDGASWGDVNGDGFLDLYVGNGAEHPPFGVGPRELYLNTPNGNRWIRVQLRGTTSNGSGIGARARFVSASGERWRYRLGESDNCFSDDIALHCGLGADTVVDSLQIFWPSGHVDTFANLQTNRSYFAIEGKPLRPMTLAHFIVLTGPIDAVMNRSQSAEYLVDVDNFGGLASTVRASCQDCSGFPVSWIRIDPESTTVWPGGRPPMHLTVDATGLSQGFYCGQVVFESDSYLGPDTLQVNLEVIESAVGVEIAGLVPDRFALGPPRPNPTADLATFDLALPAETSVEIAAHDISGRRIATLLEGTLPPGRHQAVWDLRDSAGRRVVPGVYFVLARGGLEKAVRKVVVVN